MQRKVIYDERCLDKFRHLNQKVTQINFCSVSSDLDFGFLSWLLQTCIFHLALMVSFTLILNAN